jgi:hypothetical protein
MKKGTCVRLRAPVIERRVVVDQRIDPDTDAPESLVEWTEGDVTVRAWFADADLEAIHETPSEGA